MYNSSVARATIGQLEGPHFFPEAMANFAQTSKESSTFLPSFALVSIYVSPCLSAKAWWRGNVGSETERNLGRAAIDSRDLGFDDY